MVPLHYILIPLLNASPVDLYLRIYLVFRDMMSGARDIIKMITSGKQPTLRLLWALEDLGHQCNLSAQTAGSEGLRLETTRQVSTPYYCLKYERSSTISQMLLNEYDQE